MTGISPLGESSAAKPEVLFFEGGVRWLWVLACPAAALAMVLLQVGSDSGVQVAVPMVFWLFITCFVAIQVKAARIHTSVELTAETLREGAETIDVARIISIYPEAPAPVPGRSGDWLAAQNTYTGVEAGDWQSSRTLGQLTGVPRGRTAIGLRLSDGRDVRAWARRHRKLRAALTQLVEQRRPDRAM